MWILVAMVNPIMSVLFLGVVPLKTFTIAESNSALSVAAGISAGKWLQ